MKKMLQFLMPAVLLIALLGACNDIQISKPPKVEKSNVLSISNFLRPVLNAEMMNATNLENVKGDLQLIHFFDSLDCDISQVIGCRCANAAALASGCYPCFTGICCDSTSFSLAAPSNANIQFSYKGQIVDIASSKEKELVYYNMGKSPIDKIQFDIMGQKKSFDLTFKTR